MFTHAIRYCLLPTLVAAHSLNLYAADAALGKQKAAACAGCHGQDGMGLSAEFPNLAGQQEAYLAKQLRAFKQGDRKDPTMNAMAATLSDQDIVLLAAHFAALRPTAAGAAPAGKQTVSKETIMQAFPGPVFMTMKQGASVERFPSQSVWEGGPDMLYDAVTPDTKRLLVTSPSTDSVYVFDTASGRQQAIIKVGKAPKGVKIRPDGKQAYISNEGAASISVIDLATLAVIDTIPVEEAPHNVRFTRDGQTAYVTLQGGAGIGVIDTAARKMTRVIPVPGITGPHNLDLSRDEQTAYVRDFVHNVAVLDLKTGKVRKVIEVGNGHGGIDVTPDDRYAATAAIGDNHITIINTETLATQDIEVGNGPHGIRASNDSRWLYVTVTRDKLAVVIDMHSMKVVARIPVGEFPFWIAVPGNP